MISKRDEFIYKLLINAGIKKGMRILDVGCGTGDVTLLISDLVGNSGKVIGIDMNEHAIETAKNRSKDHNNMEFLSEDILNISPNIGTFDGIVGRRVLMYQADSLKCVKSLLPFLNDGGIMAFQESDSAGVATSGIPMPLHFKVQSWVQNTVAKEGVDLHMGLNLYSTFSKAGLNVKNVCAEAVLQTPETPSDLGWLIKMMLPRIVQNGIATPEEIDIETLENRLLDEQKRVNTSFIRDMAFGIWAIKN